MILELLALVGGCATAIGVIESAVGIRDEIRWQASSAADRDGEQDDFGPGERPKLRVLWPETPRRPRAKRSSISRTSKR